MFYASLQFRIHLAYRPPPVGSGGLCLPLWRKPHPLAFGCRTDRRCASACPGPSRAGVSHEIDKPAFGDGTIPFRLQTISASQGDLNELSLTALFLCRPALCSAEHLLVGLGT